MLRDAFAFEISGEYKTFGEVGAATFKALMSEQKLKPERSTIDPILQVFADLQPHDDVKPAFEILRDAGVRIAALTNSSAETTKKMFQNAELGNFVERYISIDEVKHWKPAREVYLHAAKRLDVDLAEVALVAAHDWDIQGANQAGLITGFVARKGQRFSSAMQKPNVSGRSLEEVAKRLLALP